MLMTMRSHDEYNTTIYGMEDRYRSVFGTCRVVFANRLDLDMLRLPPASGSTWRVCGIDGIVRRAERFMLV